MRRGLRVATVVMALCFVCAAALAQTNTGAKKKKSAADAGTSVKLDYLPATKAAPMHFREDVKPIEPSPQQAPQPATQQVLPPQKK